MILLLSTYDLGRQPFGLASPAAWLRSAGHEVEAVDASRQRIDPALVTRAAVVAVYLPMHTATRLALPMIDRLRAANPKAVLCAYGLYAPLNADLLRAHGVIHVLGPEFEADLLAIASGQAAPPLGSPVVGTPSPAGPGPTTTIQRLALIQPDRRGLPALDRYASLQMPDGARRVTGSTDATRGCKHRCRHCPIVPVYDGQFRVVPVDVVLADIRSQVGTGRQAHHVWRSRLLQRPDARAAHRRGVARGNGPRVTYDVTIKVEHLLRHRDLLPRAGATPAACS